MKTLAIVALALIVGCSADMTSLPENVQSTFTEMYPNATDLEVEEIEGGFEIDFTLDGVEYEAFIDSKGEWVETEREIEIADAPEALIAGAQQAYPDYTIDEVCAIESAALGSVYEVEFEKEGSHHELDVIFDANGKVVHEKHLHHDHDVDEDEMEDTDKENSVVE